MSFVSLLCIESGVVVMSDVSNDRHISSLGLEDDEPLSVASSTTSGDLSHKLVGSFVAAEVGVVEHGVGIHDADYADVSKVESLADHLCTDKDIGTMAGKVIENVLVGITSLGGIEIKPCCAGFRQEGVEFLFDAFGTESERFEMCLTTSRAGIGQAIGRAAVVADELSEAAMIGEGNVATGTAGHPSAGGALHHGGIAAAVLEEDGLFATFKGLAKGAKQPG